MDILGRHSVLSQELTTWPTLVCRGNAQKTCSSQNAVEVLVQNMHPATSWSQGTTHMWTYECHCKSGYYSTYDGGDTRMLLTCLPCPTCATSIKGTFDTKGCFCKAGTYKNVYPDNILQQNTDIKQDLLCRDCLSRTTAVDPLQ